MKGEFNLETFTDFVEGMEGRAVAATNPYEAYRYVREGKVGIVYRNDRNKFYQCVGQAEQDLKLMHNRKPLQAMGATKRASSLRRLILRDGNKCWYCGYVPQNNQLLTIEHLLSRSEGGNHKLANLALACVECNTQADNLPIVQKVALREHKQKERNQ